MWVIIRLVELALSCCFVSECSVCFASLDEFENGVGDVCLL